MGSAVVKLISVLVRELGQPQKDVNVDLLPLGFDVKRKGQRTESVKGRV